MELLERGEELATPEKLIGARQVKLGRVPLGNGLAGFEIRFWSALLKQLPDEITDDPDQWQQQQPQHHVEHHIANFVGTGNPGNGAEDAAEPIQGLQEQAQSQRGSFDVPILWRGEDIGTSNDPRWD